MKIAQPADLETRTAFPVNTRGNNGRDPKKLKMYRATIDCIGLDALPGNHNYLVMNYRYNDYGLPCGSCGVANLRMEDLKDFLQEMGVSTSDQLAGNQITVYVPERMIAPEIISAA